MAVDLARFVEALQKLRQLYDAGAIRVVVAPQGNASFDFPDPNDPELPTSGEGLYIDLDDALAAVVSGVPRDSFVAARGSSRPMFPDPEDADLAGAKYDAVVEIFPVAALRRKAYLRRTATVRTLGSVEWEAVSRSYASLPAQPPHTEPSFALLHLRLERYTDSPLRPDTLSTVFAADSDDLDGLIASLSRAKEALDTAINEENQHGS